MAGMILLAGVGGCQTGSPEIAGAEAALAKDAGSAAFLDRVSSQATVGENDTMRGILLLLDGKDTAESFARREQICRERRIIASGWDMRSGRPVTRGKLAYMVYQGCKMPGGVILTLTGPSQRYCLRELQYQGMIASGVMYSPVGGMEFIAVLTRADSYLTTGEVPEVLSTAGGGR